MSPKSLFAAVASLATTSVIAFGGAAAQAATDSISCTFTGATASLTPIPPPPKVGGPFGTFSFSSARPYHGLASAAECVDSSGPHLVTITSTGTYGNIVCGTGDVPESGGADATATINGIPGHDPANVTYRITIVAGVGYLQITGGGTGVGIVDLTPTNTGGCVTTAVTGFDVVGQVVGVLP